MNALNPNMLNLVKDGRIIAKFERFETGKAFDWLTAKGLKIVKKEVIPFNIWVLESL